MTSQPAPAIHPAAHPPARMFPTLEARRAPPLRILRPQNHPCAEPGPPPPSCALLLLDQRSSAGPRLLHAAPSASPMGHLLPRASPCLLRSRGSTLQCPDCAETAWRSLPAPLAMLIPVPTPAPVRTALPESCTSARLPN